ncbi:MAG: hypothetical protein MUF00_06930 [Gemmatimonadaceae bacterium]|jgi:Tfp pilus assembly protein PilV|nr:hypothetical protein [Gemmatimonadaceae bacterium]
MSLLEAMVALAIVAMVALGGYELTASSARAATASAAWTEAVARAESMMDAAVAAAPIEARDGRVARVPYRPGLEQFVVEVPIRTGGTFTLRRVVPTSPLSVAGGRE